MASTGRSAWPATEARGTAKTLTVSAPGARQHRQAFTPTFSSPSFPPSNCMKCGLWTRDGHGGDRVC